MLPAILGGVFVICAAWFFWPENSRQLYQQARELLPSDPGQADALLIRSIDAAGGNFPEAQLLRCRLLGAQGRWIEALGGFTLIADTSKCPAEELAGLAQEAAAANELLLAEKAGDAAVQQKPQREEWLRPLVSVKYRLKKFDDLLKLTRQWSEASPGNPQPWEITAQTCKEMMRMQEAIDAYREAIQRTTDREQILRFRGDLLNLLIDAGDVEGARAEMDILLAAPPVTDKLRTRHAHLLRLEGDSPAALREIEEVLKTSPDSIAALMLHGILLLDEGQVEPAAADLERVVRADRYNKEAHYKLAQAYLRLNQPEKAQPHLEQSERLTEMSIEILNLIGKAKEDPDNAAIRSQIAKLYEQIGQPELAAQWRPAQR